MLKILGEVKYLGIILKGLMSIKLLATRLKFFGTAKILLIQSKNLNIL